MPWYSPPAKGVSDGPRYTIPRQYTLPTQLFTPQRTHDKEVPCTQSLVVDSFISIPNEGRRTSQDILLVGRCPHERRGLLLHGNVEALVRGFAGHAIALVQVVGGYSPSLSCYSLGVSQLVVGAGRRRRR
jgi:hypothetical protein